MDNRRNLYKRVLRVLLPMVILAGIIIGSCQIKRTHIKANNNVVYVKANVTQIIEDNSAVHRKYPQRLPAVSIRGRIVNLITQIHFKEVHSARQEQRLLR